MHSIYFAFLAMGYQRQIKGAESLSIIYIHMQKDRRYKIYGLFVFKNKICMIHIIKTSTLFLVSYSYHMSSPINPLNYLQINPVFLGGSGLVSLL